MEEASLDDFMKNNSVPEEVTAALKKDPYQVRSPKQFENYFDSKIEITTVFLAHGFWKDDGAVKANLTMAWREAGAAVEKGLKRTSAGLPEEAIDDPLRAEVGQNLARTRKLNYNFDLPSAWQGTPNLLGRFHREFSKQSHVCFCIKKLTTFEGSMAVSPSSKRTRISDDIELTHRPPDDNSA